MGFWSVVGLVVGIVLAVVVIGAIKAVAQGMRDMEDW